MDFESKADVTVAFLRIYLGGLAPKMDHWKRFVSRPAFKFDTTPESNTTSRKAANTNRSHRQAKRNELQRKYYGALAMLDREENLKKLAAIEGRVTEAFKRGSGAEKQSVGEALVGAREELLRWKDVIEAELQKPQLMVYHLGDKKTTRQSLHERAMMVEKRKEDAARKKYHTSHEADGMRMEDVDLRGDAEEEL